MELTLNYRSPSNLLNTTYNDVIDIYDFIIHFNDKINDIDYFRFRPSKYGGLYIMFTFKTSSFIDIGPYSSMHINKKDLFDNHIFSPKKIPVYFASFIDEYNYDINVS